MLWASIKNNLKTIFRDPTTALAALVAIIMQFMYGLNVYEFVNQLDVHYTAKVTRAYDYIMNVMMDVIAKPVFQIAFPFLGVIIAVNLFKEKRNSAYDIISSGQLSFRQFFLSKIITYYLLGLGMSLFLGLGFEVAYIVAYDPFQLDLEWGLILGAQLAWMAALYTSCLLVPVALGVFAAAVSGFAAAAPIVNCAYYYLPYMLPKQMYLLTKFHDFVHVVPLKLGIFMKYWPVELENWHEVMYGFIATKESSWGVDLDCSSTFVEAIFSYASMIVISTVLFAASYFLLKRRYER